MPESAVTFTGIRSVMERLTLTNQLSKLRGSAHSLVETIVGFWAPTFEMPKLLADATASVERHRSTFL